MADYVMPVPNNVITRGLLAPPEDFLLWAGWSDDVVQGTYPTQNRNERGEGLAGAHPEFVGLSMPSWLRVELRRVTTSSRVSLTPRSRVVD